MGTKRSIVKKERLNLEINSKEKEIWKSTAKKQEISLTQLIRTAMFWFIQEQEKNELHR